MASKLLNLSRPFSIILNKTLLFPVNLDNVYANMLMNNTFSLTPYLSKNDLNKS